ncbi:DUF6708 domain-containing protein [Pseudomonas syringae]|uniref:Small-conductance mechanosensitive channel n=21 Tax=Pseudomonas syringae TaxID=317 RepID=A0AAN4TNJ1_PSESF|nr:DUF6708 domain-containing protein [Pseudomonas syringae]EPN66741.1 hypothetical protein A235_10706 [Pseudomonas syringae pv. actinidiae ICMP 19079]AKT31753.1 hypothetical protein IYO_019960 [Pseudomonas syringae pv. actinidiae ICMP 18884]AOE58121.1 hypothetical protein NZ708_19940 [Pseudomonas syringae pv. actinidiae ICMP 18708]APP99076.1 hypothetical protein PsaNZ45_20495 [Pseudomonas syringae pv. actinidiae]APQ04833.1 hypothetical protein PsaNZ47_19935 [Pseudomonas syringae pv. actinidiae
MSSHPAGTCQKKLFSQNDYLAPLPLPTGQQPVDSLNIIWRKNETYLDIGCYSVGSAVMVIWPMMIMFISLAYGLNDIDLLWLGGIITGIPTLMLIHGLFRPTPPPVRFNRQRREVCVPRDNGEYWIVPWESVTAAATQCSSISQAGRVTTGLLFIGFENPDADASEDHRHFSMGFNCGGGETAMALWECMRSYMEIGPEAVPESRIGAMPYEKTQIGSIVTSLRKGDVFDVLHGLFFITTLGTYLAEKLQNLKLSPPPDLEYPDIIEWSKSLPPEKWTTRSAELEIALASHAGSQSINE